MPRDLCFWGEGECTWEECEQGLEARVLEGMCFGGFFFSGCFREMVEYGCRERNLKRGSEVMVKDVYWYYIMNSVPPQLCGPDYVPWSLF